MSNVDKDIRIFLRHLIDNEIGVNDEYFEQSKLEYIDTYSGGHVRELVLFDEDYYISQRGSRIPNGMTPIRDFFENGVKFRLSPHPIFDIGYIDSLSRSHDATASTQTGSGRNTVVAPVNPLTFVLGDESGSASPNMLFSPALYEACVRENGHLLGSYGDDDALRRANPIVHYMKNWRNLFDGGVLRISNYFDPVFYSMSAQRSSESIVDPMTHYFRSAPVDRHDCNPKFHGGYYRNTYNVQNVDALSHFLRFGAKKGFAPNPYTFDELGIARSVLPEDMMGEILVSHIQLK